MKSKKNSALWFFCIAALCLSIVTLVIVLSNHTKDINPNSSDILVASFALLVTVLIGWQIVSFFTVKDEVKQTLFAMRKELDNVKIESKKELDKCHSEIKSFEKNLDDCVIVLSCIYAAFRHKLATLRIRVWLNIIKECRKDGSPEICTQTAAAFIAATFNEHYKQFNVLNINEYVSLWDAEAFEIFMEICDAQTPYLSEDAKRVANTMNLNIKAMNQKRQSNSNL